MTWSEWAKLRKGDVIRFVGEWNPTQIGTTNVIECDDRGNAYIRESYGFGTKLFPINEFDPADFEKVEVSNEGSTE